MTKTARNPTLSEASQYAHEDDDTSRHPREDRRQSQVPAGVGTLARKFGVLWPSAQLELLDFMTRRAEAYVKWPSELAQCRSPREVWDKQARFMEEMVSDYRSTGERLMGTWMLPAGAGETREPLH
jgi:hypothetical protein